MQQSKPLETLRNLLRAPADLRTVNARACHRLAQGVRTRNLMLSSVRRNSQRYADVARWYAESEYESWRAQGPR